MAKVFGQISAFLTVFLVYNVFLCSAGDQGDYDVCVSVRQRDSPRVNNINSTSQGSLHGKMGPRGPRGLKGDVGPPGECDCDQQRLDEMQSKIDHLEDLYHQLRLNAGLCFLGLKSGQVEDSAFSASSYWGKGYLPQFARLDGPKTWVAANGVDLIGQWIQVDMGSPTTIEGVVTQGRQGYNQWITTFKISYGNSISSLHYIQNESGEDKIFTGNHDRESHKTNLFEPAITARYFRLYVVTYHGYVSLRMEYLKC